MALYDIVDPEGFLLSISNLKRTLKESVMLIHGTKIRYFLTLEFDEVLRQI